MPDIPPVTFRITVPRENWTADWTGDEVTRATQCNTFVDPEAPKMIVIAIDLAATRAKATQIMLRKRLSPKTEQVISEDQPRRVLFDLPADTSFEEAERIAYSTFQDPENAHVISVVERRPATFIMRVHTQATNIAFIQKKVQALGITIIQRLS